MKEILEFWLDNADVDGFYIDAAYHLIEDVSFRNEETSGLTEDQDDPSFTLKSFSQEDDETFELLSEWKDIIQAKNPNAILMVETSKNIEKFSKYHESVDIAIHRYFLDNFNIEEWDPVVSKSFSVDAFLNSLTKSFGSSWKNIAFPVSQFKFIEY